MVEVVLDLPGWVKDQVLPVLKSVGKAAAIALCERLLPVGKGLCKPAINALIH